NEAAHLEETLRAWETELNEQIKDFELLVINDGSKDGSGRLLDRLRKEMKNLRVIHQLNLGYERAIRRGYEASRGQYIAQVDLNGLYEPSDFLKLWENRRDQKLVLGKRNEFG